MGLSLELWTPGFARAGWLDSAASVRAILRHNARSTATAVVDGDHPRAAVLADPGTRVVAMVDDDQVFSGRVTVRQVQGPLASSTLTVTVVSDWRFLDNALAWPVPASPIGSQASAYWTMTGPAETVIKALVQANIVTRLGRPVTVATDQARGATVTASLRFDPIGDAVSALATAGGIGVSLRQVGAGVVLDCYNPTDRTDRVLSEAGGTITAASWTGTDATATRFVVGGQGEGTARTLRQVVDTTTEADAHDLVEAFLDATDLTTPASLDARGVAKLAENRPTSGISVTLAETDAVRWGKTLDLGDLVRVEVLPGLVVDDILSEVTVSWTTDGGYVVEPAIGDPDSTSPERVSASTLARLAAAVRQLRRR